MIELFWLFKVGLPSPIKVYNKGEELFTWPGHEKVTDFVPGMGKLANVDTHEMMLQGNIVTIGTASWVNTGAGAESQYLSAVGTDKLTLLSDRAIDEAGKLKSFSIDVASSLGVKHLNVGDEYVFYHTKFDKIHVTPISAKETVLTANLVPELRDCVRFAVEYNKSNGLQQIILTSDEFSMLSGSLLPVRPKAEEK